MAAALTAVADPPAGKAVAERAGRAEGRASATAKAKAADAPVAARPSEAARRASAPMAAKTRSYIRTLSATSVGLEMALSVVLPLLFGIWLDKKLGSSPWLMLLCLCFGFAAGLRAVWRYVAEADRDAAESERERGGAAGTNGLTGTGTTSNTGRPGDDARGGP